MATAMDGHGWQWMASSSLITFQHVPLVMRVSLWCGTCAEPPSWSGILSMGTACKTKSAKNISTIKVSHMDPYGPLHHPYTPLLELCFPECLWFETSLCVALCLGTLLVLTLFGHQLEIFFSRNRPGDPGNLAFQARSLQI